MKSRLTTLIVILLLAAAGGGAWYWWPHRASHDTMTGMPAATTAPAPVAASAAGTPRGDVSLDTRRQQLIGVRLATVERGIVSTTVRAVGMVRADETRQADVNVKIDGWIRELFVTYTGQPVRRGDRLFTLYSPELLAAQQELLLALQTQSESHASPIADTHGYADQLVDAARRRLTLWDVSAAQIDSIEQAGRPLDAITVTSPAAGVVFEKTAVQGMRVMAGQTLYRIADLSSVWIEADVYERDIAGVRIGQAATVRLDAYPGRTFTGRAIYILPTVNEQTRTTRVRFQFANSGGLLKPGMFANVELREGERRGPTVPANAVLDSGTQQVVFVADGAGTFTPRTVTVGARAADRVEIVSGLKEGEQVAESATFFLDSESQLRASLQNYESAQPATAAPTGPAPVIAFRTQVDPPKTGDNVFEVTVKDPSGQPITDAQVRVQLFMPAMPTMNMPSMRNEITVMHAGAGVYRGAGLVLMAGHWDVTVTVTRNGQRVGSQQFALNAR